MPSNKRSGSSIVNNSVAPTAIVSKTMKYNDHDGDEHHVEITEDDVQSEVHEAIPVIDRAKYIELEHDMKAKERLHKEDSENAVLLDEFRISERRFHKSLFSIHFCKGNSVSWMGWIDGYCKEIR